MLPSPSLPPLLLLPRRREHIPIPSYLFPLNYLVIPAKAGIQSSLFPLDGGRLEPAPYLIRGWG